MSGGQYYAAYYAASAVLLSRGHRFSSIPEYGRECTANLVKPGDLPQDLGRFYDRLFRDRQHGDYLELVEFTSDQLDEAIRQAEELVSALERLVKGAET
ncbi:MAG: HEPN domain-containing protein [Candidatus Binatia bacterium]